MNVTQACEIMYRQNGCLIVRLDLGESIDHYYQHDLVPYFRKFLQISLLEIVISLAEELSIRQII
jgi:hypothetical protein